MFREILSSRKLTIANGMPVEIAQENLFGIRKKLDECLSPKQCGGEKPDCWLEVEIKSDRGIGRKKLIKYCDLRIEGNPISIPQK